MTIAILRTMFRRDIAALRREIEAYPDDESLWKPMAGVPNTGGTLGLHLAGNLQHFFGAVLAKDGYVRDRDAEFARRNVSRAEILRGLDNAQASVDKTLAQLDDLDLQLPYPELVAKKKVNTGLWLTHLAVHLTYHLGQIDFHRRAATKDERGIDAVSVRELPEVG
ncbi:MAG TPA: DinB family protein [Gemmatimonadaceae bacterium]